MATNKNIAHIGGIVAAASAIAGKVNSATPPQVAQAYIRELMQLLQQANGLGINVGMIAGMIDGIIASIQSKLADIEITRHRIDEVYKHWGADTQKLYDGLDRLEDESGNKILTVDDKKFLASLDPRKNYEAVVFDDKGNLVIENGKPKTEMIKGEQIQKSYLIIKKHANKDNKGISDADRAHMNSAEGKKELREAIRHVQGHAHSVAKTEDKKKEIVDDTKEILSLLNQPASPATDTVIQRSLVRIGTNITSANTDFVLSSGEKIKIAEERKKGATLLAELELKPDIPPVTPLKEGASAKITGIQFNPQQPPAPLSVASIIQPAKKPASSSGLPDGVITEGLKTADPLISEKAKELRASDADLIQGFLHTTGTANQPALSLSVTPTPNLALASNLADIVVEKIPDELSDLLETGRETPAPSMKSLLASTTIIETPVPPLKQDPKTGDTLLSSTSIPIARPTTARKV